MLDVHPPHEPTHTWKDFFIHVGTICVGLIIAVGLEQAVEYFHHRHQIAETREALAHEWEVNRHYYQRYLDVYRWENVAVANNMTVLQYLQSHPGTAQEKLPGVLTWIKGRALFAHAAWDEAQTSGVLNLMPADEVLRDQNRYSAFTDISNQERKAFDALNEAQQFLFSDPDPTHLTPLQIAKEIELTQRWMTEQYMQGILMAYMVNIEEPNFGSGPSYDELYANHHIVNPRPNGSLAEAYAATLDRLKAAGYPRNTIYLKPQPEKETNTPEK